jgi:hypothetical protein
MRCGARVDSFTTADPSAGISAFKAEPGATLTSFSTGRLEPGSRETTCSVSPTGPFVDNATVTLSWRTGTRLPSTLTD